MEDLSVTLIFDDSNPNWTPSQDLNTTFLKCQENYFNDKRRINGYVFLNEVYEALGFPRTALGQVVGWVDQHIEILKFYNDPHSVGLAFKTEGAIFSLFKSPLKG